MERIRCLSSDWPCASPPRRSLKRFPEMAPEHWKSWVISPQAVGVTWLFCHALRVATKASSHHKGYWQVSWSVWSQIRDINVDIKSKCLVSFLLLWWFAMALSFTTSPRSKGHPFPYTAPLLSFPTHTLLIYLAFSAFILYSIMAGCPFRLHQASYRHVLGLVYLVSFVCIITGSASSQHIGRGHLRDATAGVWQIWSGKNGGICQGQILQTCKCTKKTCLNPKRSRDLGSHVAATDG